MIIVKPARPADAERIREIAIRSGIDAWTVAHYQEEAAKTESLVLIAVNEAGNTVGFFSGRTVGGATRDLDGEIYGIAVSSETRRQGIGKALLGNAMAWFRSNQSQFVWLEVRTSNISAVQFYENNGFREAGIRKNFYAHPTEDAIVMKLTIDDYPVKTSG